MRGRRDAAPRTTAEPNATPARVTPAAAFTATPTSSTPPGSPEASGSGVGAGAAGAANPAGADPLGRVAARVPAGLAGRARAPADPSCGLVPRVRADVAAGRGARAGRALPWALVAGRGAPAGRWLPWALAAGPGAPAGRAPRLALRRWGRVCGRLESTSSPRGPAPSGGGLTRGLAARADPTVRLGRPSRRTIAPDASGAGRRSWATGTPSRSSRDRRRSMAVGRDEEVVSARGETNGPVVRSTW